MDLLVNVVALCMSLESRKCKYVYFLCHTNGLGRTQSGGSRRLMPECSQLRTGLCVGACVHGTPYWRTQPSGRLH
jgi:hypothetical protein